MAQMTSAHLKSFLAALLLLVGTVQGGLAGELIGKVVAVHDGDSLTLLTEDKTQVKIRLASIDAPEMGQAFGKAAKQALSELVFGKTVSVTDHGKDLYKRTLGDVYVEQTWVNMAMVEQGMAWLFVKYSKDSRIRAAETRARETGLGLWHDDSPVPPWEWRKTKRNDGAP